MEEKADEIMHPDKPLEEFIFTEDVDDFIFSENLQKPVSER